MDQSPPRTEEIIVSTVERTTVIKAVLNYGCDMLTFPLIEMQCNAMLTLSFRGITTRNTLR